MHADKITYDLGSCHSFIFLLTAGKNDEPVPNEIAAEQAFPDAYDIIPYACSDNIEIREEEFTSECQTGQVRQHNDSLSPVQDQTFAAVVLSNAVDQRDGQNETEENVPETAVVHNALDHTNIKPMYIHLLDDTESNVSVIGVESAEKDGNTNMPYAIANVEANMSEAPSPEEIPSAYLKIRDETIELVQSKCSPSSNEASDQRCLMISAKKPSSDTQTSTYTQLFASE